MSQKKKITENDLIDSDVVRGQGVINIKGGMHAGRDVIMGNQYNVISPHLGVSPFTPPPDLEQLRADYLAHLQRSYRALDFKGIPQLEAFSRELLLEEVYVPLLARPELPGGETWDRRRLAGRLLEAEDLPEAALLTLEKGDPGPARIEEALGRQPRLVVLGDPGSGKSTLLKYMTLRLAAEAGAPLPILLPLNAYAAALERSDMNLQTFLPQYYAGLAHGLEGLQPLFDAALRGGQAVILLDGLDEVQSERVRPLLVQRVEAFAAESVARGNRLAITSRIVGYRESPLRSKDWSLYTLLDFDAQAIRDFAERWCLAFEKSALGDTPEARAAAEGERRSLLAAIEANRGVAQLAANPLLLTILALIKRYGVTLPNRRVELYELYLKTLISAWSKARALDRRPVGKPLDYLETIAVLGPLALWLRQENPTAGLAPEERLVEWLTLFYQGAEWGMKKAEAMKAARDFLDSVRKYSNLLLERGQGRFGFIHLTFEEALAARGLVQRGQLRLEDSLSLVREHLTDPAWRETILLAVGVWGLVREQPLVAGEVARAMLQMDCAGADACQNVLLAGACLEDVGELGLGRAAANEVVEALQAAAANRALPPAAQRDAGFGLGRLAGSSRQWLERIRPDLDDFVQIPAGEFLYGDEDEKEKRRISEPFAIGKYPVTNLQYRRFVEAGGYEQRRWWGEDGWAWRAGTYDSKASGSLKEWLQKNRPVEERGEPFYWNNGKWNNPLAPVVGVSWFEAEAYCNWLSQQEGRPVRLPTEQEWERAARGVAGREYAWGNRFDHTRLNNAEFWAGKDDLDWNKWVDEKSYEPASTTIVGQFPSGATPEGIGDLSGNVWEWTASWYEEEQVNRVLRGGAWGGGRWNARCACRVGDAPDDFGSHVGFRLVSPGILLPSDS